MGLENATKIMNYVTEAGKEYICVMQVHCDIEKDLLKSIIEKFKGKIYQRPPVRSSVKRRLRFRTVNEIELLETYNRMALLRISSEPGTYMRKICHDAGILLGCGAHMRELRRIRSGIFTEKNLVTLQEVSEALYMWKSCKDEEDLRKILIPMEMAFCGIPKIVIDDNAVDAIAYGASVMIPGIVAFQNFKKGDLVGILTLKGEAVAVGIALVDSKNLSSLEKGEAIKPKRVLIQKDLYPRSWK
ncbi:RNA-guided pseudouridylation complex pseudouridine synthase subunit Cbf5 [Acidianus brierleyi]|uniref:RNA-guided pseudouridylation complex pseudouridine synthase subunit Cbf5 n=2 Tax=Acidianus brierleyi TaxID=41673 RepID=A0A2U9IEP4_9CREN|nr:RNA-guided pseudouridylation complex pseudouridine synthase subunit Cbf5 [Acidianus brierleyi]